MSSENYEKLRLAIRGVEARTQRIEEHLGLAAPPPVVAGAQLRPPRETESSANKPTVTRQTHGVAHTMTVRRVGAPVVRKPEPPPAPAPAVVPSSVGPQVAAGVGEQLLGMLEGLTGLLHTLRPPQPGEQVSPAAEQPAPAAPEAGELDWLAQEPQATPVGGGSPSSANWPPPPNPTVQG